MKMRSARDDQVQDKKGSVEYQRFSWLDLKKTINEAVNNVTAKNIREVADELFDENLTRGRGLFCQAIMKSQMESAGEFTPVFSALASMVNSRFPDIGALLVKRIVLQLITAHQINSKAKLMITAKFLAHLVNQLVVDDVIARDLLTILLMNPNYVRVEVAVGFVTECGAYLQNVYPKFMDGVFNRFHEILYEEEIYDQRIEFLIKNALRLPKSGFRGHPAVHLELDLVEVEDQVTHQVPLILHDENVNYENALDVLGNRINPEKALDVFHYDPDFLEKERKHEIYKNSILDSDDEVSNQEENSNFAVSKNGKAKIHDCMDLRNSIYLIIMSSDGIVEAGMKILQIMRLNPGEEMHLCQMLLECCIQEKAYKRYYGFLGERLCKIKKVYCANFEVCFVQQYSIIHQLNTDQVCNVAHFFAHLLAANALPWSVLSCVRLTEEETTSCSRVFVKLVFQELAERLGILMLRMRLMQESFDQSIFPKDSLKNTRFSIDFFTSIGLGRITDNLQKIAPNASSLEKKRKEIEKNFKLDN